MSLFPAFLKLAGRRVVVIGAGPVAASKLQALVDAGATVTVVAPDLVDEIATRHDVTIVRRAFEPRDLDDAWLVVAAATPAVNRAVAEAANARHLFVNAVDDPPNASLYLGGVVRRAGVTFAISTDGQAPALAGLLREALDAQLPAEDLEAWMRTAAELRARWRADGVPMAKRRPELLEALIGLYEPATVHPPSGPGGFVSIIGAGPGDPELLTLKAAQRLDEADLVLYDGLVQAEVVARASGGQRFCVSKRAGQPAVNQETIHRLMIRAARDGKRVVRLKGGDPFVLGRGGEEALALSAAGVAFEVIPGISAAVAAPGLAGIPVTHRGLASGFTVVSGHAPDAFAPIVRGLPPGAMTLVVLMGIRHTSRIAGMLLEYGWAADTPAAIVFAASTPDMRVWTGRLDELSEAVATTDISRDRPGTIVVGEVASLREPAAATPTRTIDAVAMQH